MNKGELIERVTGRLGDQKVSSAAVDALVTEIQNAVTKGDKVNISGFGVFEKRDRAPRTGRNPRTGEPIEVAQTSVPVFRPGQTFKTLVAGGKEQRRGQSGRSQTGRAQPAQSSRTQTARAQTSRTQTARAQGSRMQPARAQASRTQSGRAQSSYARGGQGQSSYARSTSQRQSARARTR
jgi:DNA-binding protein HU-beta